MRAAIFRENGGPEVVTVEDVDPPVPAHGEVRIRVEAAAMNHLDLWVRRGLPIETPMPHIGGSDIVGVVDQAASEADAHWIGQRVVVDPSLSYQWYELAATSAGTPGRSSSRRRCTHAPRPTVGSPWQTRRSLLP